MGALTINPIDRSPRLILKGMIQVVDPSKLSMREQWNDHTTKKNDIFEKANLISFYKNREESEGS